MKADTLKVDYDEYSKLLYELNGLPFEEAWELRSQLTAKYFEYLDRLFQLKNVVRDFEQIEQRIKATRQ